MKKLRTFWCCHCARPQMLEPHVKDDDMVTCHFCHLPCDLTLYEKESQEWVEVLDPDEQQTRRRILLILLAITSAFSCFAGMVLGRLA